MDNFNLSTLAETLQLQRKSERKVSTEGSLPYTMHSYQYTRMYKRTQFNMNVGVQQVQNYFSSKFRPNILTVPITIQASGIITQDDIDTYEKNYKSLIRNNELNVGYATYSMLCQEFYKPCVNILSDFIRNLFLPEDILLIGKQYSSDQGDDISNIVQDTYKGESTQYRNVVISHTYTYKIYYPIWSNQRGAIYTSTGRSLDKSVISLNVSAQDKVYRLTKTMIDYEK